MSMEMNGTYGQYPIDNVERERMKAEQEKAKESEKGQNGEKAPVKGVDLQDEYISSEKSAVRPSGLYRLGQDGEGRKKVFFDDPKQASKQPDRKSDKPEKSAEKCIGNTDKADREIQKLKEKKKELERQIRSASGDEKKVRELEKKLAQVESELSRKDNDTYRRQHTTFSNIL